MKLNVFGAALMALVATASMASAQLQFNLAPDGDFTTGAAAWGTAVGGGSPDPTITFETTGGNSDGYGKIDQTAGGWGVLIAQNDTPVSLASLQLVAGQNYDFQFDMIDETVGGGGIGGLKLESWDDVGTTPLDATGDNEQFATTSWATYTQNYTIAAGATGIKLVPVVSVGGANVNSIIGFDNVGVLSPAAVPEPASLSLIALGVIGLVSRRRRA